MKITMIYPRFGKGYESSARLEPLVLAVLAGLTPKGHTIRAVDERLEEIPFSEPTDLVAISVCTFSAKRAYDIAASFRQKGVPVVLGGYHPTLQPEEALEHADSVVVGDAEFTWPQVVADAAANKLQRLYAPVAPGPAVAVSPDRSVFQGKRYLPMSLIQFGRGCPRACEFCSIHAFYGSDVVYRKVEAVVAELKAIRARRVFFVDDNLMADPNALRSLMEAILPLRLRWSSQMDMTIADHPDLLDLARRSGCQSLTIGFESLNDGNLRQMSKGWNQASSFERRLARLRQAGIMVYGTFVFGYDEDDSCSFQRTLDFVFSQRFFIANFNPLQPFPGTRLYERLQKEARLVYDRWWMEPSHRWKEALVHPKRMTAEQLTTGCHWARERFHSFAGIARRLPSRAHFANLDNLAVYLASNWVSRREVRAKLKVQNIAP